MATNTRIANRRGVSPIGTIIAFYDFGAGGPGGAPLTFDTKTWKYCDGTAVVDADSPLNGLVTPDMSGRYLVGFAAVSTEGGGDIGTEPWATPAVGNSGNVLDISHTHTLPNHSHTLNQHYHTAGTTLNGVTGSLAGTITGGAHNHTSRATGMTTTSGDDESSWNYRVRDDSYGWTNRNGTSDQAHIGVFGGTNNEGQHGHTIGNGTLHTHSLTMTSTSKVSGPSTANTSTKTGFESNSESPSLAAQDIRPRSVRVRFLMKIA